MAEGSDMDDYYYSQIQSYLLVAAFDFGTTYSGYALSFRDDPTRIQVNQEWISGSQSLISLKTPTCVLLNPRGEFDAFGFEAENKYVSLACDDLHNGWRLFRNFKMVLHNNKSLNRQTYVEDIVGQPAEALDLVAMSLKYLREQLLEAIRKQRLKILESELRYVITVPAIWDDNAKQFMREAAVKAGMSHERLLLALEPEAASIWCSEGEHDLSRTFQMNWSLYMVVDIGGGTADISVHERLSNGQLRELHKANGGPYGGAHVDQNFFKLLSEIFGQHSLDEFKKKEMYDYMELMREWEMKKMSITPDEETFVIVRIPSVLKEYCANLSGLSLADLVRRSGYENKIEVKRGDKLKISASLLCSCFNKPIDSLIEHVKILFQDPKLANVSTILLVGGMAESNVVQNAFRTQFPDKTVLIPSDASLAVLKGAAMFGHSKRYILSRIARYTYGVGVKREFDPKLHDAAKSVRNKEKDWVYGFEAFVRKGTDILANNTITKEGFSFPKDGSGRIKIYKSSESFPVHIQDPGCEKIGELVLPKERKFKSLSITFVFGETEILVLARINKSLVRLFVDWLL